MADVDAAAARLAAHLTARRAEREKLPPQAHADGAVKALAGLFAGLEAPISEDALWALLEERARLRALAPDDRAAVGDDEEFFVPGHVYVSANGWWRFECAVVAAGVALGRELCLKDREKPGFTRRQVWRCVKPAGSWTDVTDLPAPTGAACAADQVSAQPVESAASDPPPEGGPAAVNRHADQAALLRTARDLRAPVPDKGRLGRALNEGCLTADDVHWVYRAAAYIECVVQELEPGALRSSADLPDEPPLFTTRRLFAALEQRIARVEDLLGLDGDDAGDETTPGTRTLPVAPFDLSGIPRPWSVPPRPLHEPLRRAPRHDPYEHLSPTARLVAGLPPRAEPETPAQRHRRDHHGDPVIMQLGCPLCAQELASRFEMSPDAVMRAMLGARGDQAPGANDDA